MKNLKLTLAALTLGVFALPAFAQTTTPNTPNIDKRQAEQQKRIDQGVKSGQLTNRETKQLERGQAKVQRMEAKAKADGKVTPRERRAIEREQNKQSRLINKDKHNAQQK
jgi:uncharacterized membrane protein YebE (DUF533 family)